MKVSEIRPLSTYIGIGGVTRIAKSIKMGVDGRLTVEWRRVAGSRHNRDTPLKGSERIEDFASWAKVLVDTWSADLAHHLVDSHAGAASGTPLTQ